MADKKALYSTCVAVLGFVCFVVGATAVGLPMWGYFDTPNGEFLKLLFFMGLSEPVLIAEFANNLAGTKNVGYFLLCYT